MVLQLIFGMTYTNLDDYLLFAKRIIIMVLQDHPMAEVQIPNTEKIEEYVEMVNRRHPYLLDVIRNGIMPHLWGINLSHIYAREVR